MSGYLGVFNKEIKPKLKSFVQDWRAKKDKDFFQPTGTQVYVGRQGSGKTVSAVHHLLRLKARYPKSIIVSNIDLKYYNKLRFNTRLDINLHLGTKNDPTKSYFFFESMEQLSLALTGINNGFHGVIYIIDEIHTYFNALDSKSIPPHIFTEISQQRKQRKVIIGTSQLFLRMAKPFREQCDNLIMCNTIFGVFTFTRAYDGMTLTQDYDGNLNGHQKKVGWFWHTPILRNAYDTYQKVVSSDLQFETIQPTININQSKKAWGKSHR